MSRTEDRPTGSRWRDGDATGAGITDLVATLDRRLRGPRRAKDDLLTEVRDGLHDAAEAYRAAGLTPDEAERRAVTEFGSPYELAVEFQAELTVAQSRRTCLALLLLPLLVVGWDLVWLVRPGGALLPEVGASLARGFDLTALLAAVGAVLALLGSRWARHPRASTWLARVTGAMAVAALLANLVVITLMLTADPAGARADVMAWPAVLVGWVFSATALTVLFRSALRCLRLTGRAAGHPVPRDAR
ncbi:MAG TPA: permease prefix domain 1-containing protein [Pseudonocardiaceae bacterium]